MPDGYGSHRDYMELVAREADERQQAIQQVLRTAFAKFIETRSVEVIVFADMDVFELATAIQKFPFVLKPLTGGYRSPDLPTRILSVIPEQKHRIWFQQIWTGVTGASTKNHPAPYPLELAERLVRMFSFVGDTVLDPFMGTGTTNVAAAKWGRNSIGVELDSDYFSKAADRIDKDTRKLFSGALVRRS